MTAARGTVCGVLLLAAALAAGGVARADSAQPAAASISAVAELPALIPLPGRMERRPGCLRLSALQGVVVPKDADADTRRVAGFVCDWLRDACGVRTAAVAEGASPGPAVVFEHVERKHMAAEAYRLEASPAGIRVASSSTSGFFYALQTLKQLAPAGAAEIPGVSIHDAPRFGWRGMHLDVSRHFFPKAFVKKYIDLLAERKLNVFHWHLTDGPGWRIEIKKYPRLTEVGAWRKDKRAQPWDWRATELCFDGRTPDAYGGFYTQEDVREIVRYAKERFVTVIPEIEMPGHSYAALAAYPEFACEGNNVRVDGLRGCDVFCAGNGGTYTFLENVLDEVAALFPDAPYIHIGGDEVPDLAWKRCAKCRALMQKLGLRSPRELQANFIGRIARHLAAKGRKIIGWDEIMEGPLPKDAAVMVWHDAKYANKALGGRHPLVMAPVSRLYFDYALSPVPAGDAPSAGAGPTLEQLYAYNPADGFSRETENNYFLGVEGCLWTEHVQTEARALHQLLPRLDALAEIAWTWQERRGWADFKKRLDAKRKAAVAAGLPDQP